MNLLFLALAKSGTESATASAGLLNLPRVDQVIFFLFNFLIFIYVVFLWLLLVNWVGQDARRRGIGEKDRQLYQGLVLVFTLPGLLLYFLLRPSLTLEEKKRAEMEEELLELELKKLRREAGKI